MNLQTTLQLLTSTKHLAASFISPLTIDSPALSLLYSVLSCSFSSQSALWFILSSLKKWVLNQSSSTLNLSTETTQRNVYGTIVNYQSPCCLWFFPLCVFFWLCANPDPSDQCFSWIDNPSNYMYVWYSFSSYTYIYKECFRHFIACSSQSMGMECHLIKTKCVDNINE